MTASQQRRLDEHRTPYAASTMSTKSTAFNGFQKQTHIEEPVYDQGSHVTPDRQLVATFVPPKCAVLFHNLRLAHWDYFGIPSDITPRFDKRLMHIWALEPNAVYEVLSARLGLLELLRDFSEAIKQATLRGMTEQAAETFASRKLMLDLGKSIDPKQTSIDEFAMEFDFRIKIAKRIASLVDAVGVVEVLLISFDDDDVELPNDVPMLTFIELTDEEWVSLLSQLLNPVLQLKETCLKLSGVVPMIEKLDGLEKSTLRTFLAQEIRRRVKDVFGEVDESDEDDSSMADVETDIS
ncbi:hypothetical protein PEBR_39639 [Penicillium brasilianum]|uniref:Uncharacterized protein n=1 Tax=Penicillium brasilianum TaxID=104259 RepID=A0A1S9R9V7_PENBI|nr:hypothetical protein PEBR_39639 [Penicillium brasilianum]